MLCIKIPGREELSLNHLILDYNGTIAEDGEIIEGIRPRLAELAKELSIYVITADTHGTAAKKNNVCAGKFHVIGKTHSLLFMGFTIHLAKQPLSCSVGIRI